MQLKSEKAVGHNSCLVVIIVQFLDILRIKRDSGTWTKFQPATPRSRDGYTLVEVLMAVMVIGLMTISLYAGLTYGFGIVQMSREDLRATQILMQKMESVRLCTWSSLTNCPITFKESYDPSATGNGGHGTVYSGTVTTNVASSIPSAANYKTNMCMVTVTVYWTNYLGKQSLVRSRQMQTQIARYGLQNYIWGSL